MKKDEIKIGLFLTDLNAAEFIYLEHLVHLVRSVKDIISKYNITKEEFCSKMQITEYHYQDFISGNYPYTLVDFASLNALWMELRIESLKNEVPIQIVK